MKSKLNNTRGFTLIELMTSLTIFAVIMTISMGSILGVFNANRKSESMKTIMDNLNFTMETMSREMRFAINYHCGTSGAILEPQDCSGSGEMAYTNADGSYAQYRYRTDLKSIEKSLNGNTWIAITSPEVTITGLQYWVSGTQLGDNIQPRVLIQVRGYAGSKPNTQTSFTLQTLVTQRARVN